MHIGAPKTGTTYLQDRLARNAKSLAAHHVHVPSRSPLVSTGLFHFRAALDLLDQDWGGVPGHAEGSWDVMVKRVRRLSGTVIISHEILAPAEPDQIARLRRDLDDCELHIVYSARDLARQAPAGWQESIKQGRRWSYRRYLKKVRSGKLWFARAFDLPTVLSRWGTGLSPDRVHVVTVPQPAAVAGGPRPALDALLYGVRDQPRLGAARERPLQRLARQRRDPGPPSAQPAAVPRRPSRRVVRRPDPRDARRGHPRR